MDAHDDSIGPETSLGFEGPPPPDPSQLDTSDMLRVDDRLLVLEHDAKKFHGHLVKFEDALINQIVAVGALELVFAVFLAIMVWTQYRERVVVANGTH